MTTTTSLTSRLAHMDQMLEQLCKELQPHSHEALNARPAPGKWSPLQVMHHLMLAERLALQYLRKKLSFNPTLKKANWKTAFRAWFTKVYLKVPIKVKAPKGVGEGLPEVSDFGEVVKEWKGIRKDMRTFLEELPKDLLDKELYKHPLAGRLDLGGMLGFMEAHMERHLGQIRRGVKPQ